MSRCQGYCSATQEGSGEGSTAEVQSPKWGGDLSLVVEDVAVEAGGVAAGVIEGWLSL